MRILLVLVLCFSFLFATVDINKADKNELTKLHGIGVKKAAKIVAFREKNGCFKSIEDLTKVNGIGKKTLEKNKDNLGVSECEQVNPMKNKTNLNL